MSPAEKRFQNFNFFFSESFDDSQTSAIARGPSLSNGDRTAVQPVWLLRNFVSSSFGFSSAIPAVHHRLKRLLASLAFLESLERSALDQWAWRYQIEERKKVELLEAFHFSVFSSPGRLSRRSCRLVHGACFILIHLAFVHLIVSGLNVTSSGNHHPWSSHHHSNISVRLSFRW